MKCTVAGKDVPVSEFGIRSMNFGQDVPGRERLPFAIRATMEEFFSACSGIYREFAEDDILHGEPDEEVSLLEIRRMGWPSLDTLVGSHPAVAERFFNRWMLYNFLSALLLAYGSKEPARFDANETTGIQVAKDDIVLTGYALALP